MRWDEKIPNGKLVSMEVWAENGRVGKVRISGDFFLHPEEKIDDVERALEGLPLLSDERAVAARITAALDRARLVGASAEDLARIFLKAAGGVEK